MMVSRAAPLVALAAIALAACGGNATQASHDGTWRQPGTQPAILPVK